MVWVDFAADRVWFLADDIDGDGRYDRVTLAESCGCGGKDRASLRVWRTNAKDSRYGWQNLEAGLSELPQPTMDAQKGPFDGTVLLLEGRPGALHRTVRLKGCYRDETGKRRPRCLRAHDALSIGPRGVSWAKPEKSSGSSQGR